MEVGPTDTEAILLRLSVLEKPFVFDLEKRQGERPLLHLGIHLTEMERARRLIGDGTDVHIHAFSVRGFVDA